MFEKLLCFLPWTCSNGFNSWISLTMHVVFILRWSPDSMLSWDFVHTCMLIYQIVPQWSLYHQSPCMLCLWNELFCLHTSVERSLYWGDCIFSGPNHLQCFFPWPPFQLVKNPHLNSSACRLVNITSIWAMELNISIAYLLYWPSDLKMDSSNFWFIKLRFPSPSAVVPFICRTTIVK